MVHDALQQLVSGGIAGSANQDARLASQIRQGAAQPTGHALLAGFPSEKNKFE